MKRFDVKLSAKIEQFWTVEAEDEADAEFKALSEPPKFENVIESEIDIDEVEPNTEETP
jgi:hypothetical protein